jgi:hypothetical protein
MKTKNPDPIKAGAKAGVTFAFAQSAHTTNLLRELKDCCIGSRAAFALLLGCREAINDANLRLIIKRLDDVIGRTQ